MVFAAQRRTLKHVGVSIEEQIYGANGSAHFSLKTAIAAGVVRECSN
jgi:hypothetical protein